MNVEQEIEAHLASHPETKQNDLRALHERILKLSNGAKLWYLDGTNDEGKMVTNPNVGYGNQLMNYADGSSREFYKVGFSAGKSGISVYIIGIPDKKFLIDNYVQTIGKAKVTGYCINFKALKDINLDVLDAAVKFGLERE